MDTGISVNVGLMLCFMMISCFALYAYSLYYRMRFKVERRKNVEAILINSGLVGLGVYFIDLLNKERGQFNDLIRVLKDESRTGGSLKVTTTLGKWLAEKNIPMNIGEKKKLDVEKFINAIKQNEKEFHNYLNS